MRETRERFEARYPRPRTSLPEEYKRVLVECTCDYYGDEAEPHWSWAYWYFDEGFMSLSGDETLAEAEPTPGADK